MTRKQWAAERMRRIEKEVREEMRQPPTRFCFVNPEIVKAVAEYHRRVQSNE